MKNQIFTKEGGFLLESGEELAKLELCYSTYGRLNETKDNVIWVVHALTANAEVDDWWAGLFGSGNIFDPERYFIICANNLGSPYGSTSPMQNNPKTGDRYGLDFPFFTIRDSARTLLELKRHLDLNGVHLLIGGSCGGNIALEFAMVLGEQLNRMVLLCCSLKEAPWTIGIHQTQRNVLLNDPEFFNKQNFVAKKSLQVSREIALPYYRTPQSINEKQKEESSKQLKDFKVISYLAHQGKKFSNRFDAQCYFVLLNTLDTHNLERGFNSMSEAVKKIQADVLVLGIDTDLLIPIQEQKDIHRHLSQSTYAEIKSIYGHDAFLIETDQIKQIISSHWHD